MIVIGEKINATRKTVGEAILKRDTIFISELALSQDKAGADYIDVNAGDGSGEESKGKDAIKWLVETVKAVTEKPLTIDSDNPEVIEAGLSVYGDGTVMVNSVTAEPERLATVGKMAADKSANVVALAMGAEGIPDNVKQRIEACDIIMNALTGMGVKEEQVYFDPLVLPVSVDAKQGQVTLGTIKEIKTHYPAAKTVVGLSNISYGLPSRKLVNRAFLLMAAQAGLDAAIMDPLDDKMMSMVRIARLLGGKETTARPFIRAHRSGKIVD
ncbi:MAG: dihydropteroate synthase [Dehalococcoidales bacterium]|nr:dihydropteroate synthase [Dehalococcoidales bacterium]